MVGLQFENSQQYLSYAQLYTALPMTYSSSIESERLTCNGAGLNGETHCNGCQDANGHDWSESAAKAFAQAMDCRCVVIRLSFSH